MCFGTVDVDVCGGGCGVGCRCVFLVRRICVGGGVWGIDVGLVYLWGFKRVVSGCGNGCGGKCGVSVRVGCKQGSCEWLWVLMWG